ncbi:MAG: recombinase family protein, partial [Phycisphaerae bacterium]|nr:recombinase family protein [Phycisphaerae bacterium]
AGCQLISLKENIDTSGAYGRFMYAIFSALAELEREIVSERTSDAMRRHVQNGRPMGGNVPFGWRICSSDPDGNYVKDDNEQAAISRMQTLSEDGLGLRAIGRQLESEGILCRGHAWHHNTVAKILERVN